MTLTLRMVLRRMRRLFENLSAMQSIVLVFLTIILAGAGLLMLPVSAKSGEATPFLTALFTATSCTCVTGLSLVDTFTHWSVFGQAVLLALIQIGGLGFMTIMLLFLFAAHRKVGLKERLIIAQSFGVEKLSGIVKLGKKVLIRTLMFEGIGALVLTIRFLFIMPFGRALWCGVFHSVSAFCNAGFDVLGDLQTGGSLTAYVADPVVNITLILLILIGGLGFFVWEDIRQKKSFRALSVYTKLVLLISGVLLLGGAALFAVLEWNNPATLGMLSVGEKIVAALFQSMTTRTAGFYTVNQGALTDASVAVTELLMFIGGGSGSTAGGAKMVTVAVLLLSVWSTARGRTHTTVMHRNIGGEQVRNAVALVVMMFLLAVASAVVLSVSGGVGMRESFYETVSAIATVGLSTGITPQLGALSHLILIVLMFFGRVGIMTFSLGFLFADKAQERYRYADAKLLIG